MESSIPDILITWRPAKFQIVYLKINKFYLMNNVQAAFDASTYCLLRYLPKFKIINNVLIIGKKPAKCFYSVPCTDNLYSIELHQILNHPENHWEYSEYGSCEPSSCTLTCIVHHHETIDQSEYIKF